MANQIKRFIYVLFLICSVSYWWGNFKFLQHNFRPNAVKSLCFPSSCSFPYGKLSIAGRSVFSCSVLALFSFQEKHFSGQTGAPYLIYNIFFKRSNILLQTRRLYFRSSCEGTEQLPNQGKGYFYGYHTRNSGLALYHCKREKIF